MFEPLISAKVLTALCVVAMIAIRAPHGRRNRRLAVADNRAGWLERILLAGVGVGMVILPLVWILVPIFSDCDYAPRALVIAIGALVESAGLWLFYRAHSDLGTNWSVSLAVRERHTLVTSGVYARIRHPMYSAAFLIAAGFALIIPNWLVGLLPIISFGTLYALRINHEERMMRDRFGEAYAAYCARTKRVIPGWL